MRLSPKHQNTIGIRLVGVMHKINKIVLKSVRTNEGEVKEIVIKIVDTKKRVRSANHMNP